MIYFTSDLHFCHQREFLYGPRGFSNIQEHNETIIKNWDKIIKPTDEVYVLGDLMLNNDVEGMRCLRQLVGTIHIILGNHDTENRVENYRHCYNVTSVSYADKIKYQNYHFYLSHYPTITSNFDYDKPLKARLINLCGHTHTKNKFEDWDRYDSPVYHVELDAHDNKPISIDDIIQDIELKDKDRRKQYPG